MDTAARRVLVFSCLARVAFLFDMFTEYEQQVQSQDYEPQNKT
jgi:hypothetical protein